MITPEIRSSFENAAKDLKNQICEISTTLFNNPELSLKEYRSSEYLRSVLEKYGFDISTGTGGLETAFTADLKRPGSKNRSVVFMAEYDALPGYGPDKHPAHACGHNWIAASSMGAALILSRIEGWSGTASLFGTPAEETLGGKINMLASGAFDGYDAAFEMHLHECDSMNPKALAIDPIEFTFLGKASHASSAPHLGINALDAVNLTFAGLNAMRQQLRSDARVHGIVTDGGAAPNIIPERASCRFYARAKDREYLNIVSERLLNCAKGAALMTGAELKINRFENSFDDLALNPALMERMEELLVGTGMGPFDHSEPSPGSTDVGNVSHKIPTFYGYAGAGDGVVRPHAEEFIDYVNDESSREKAVKCALAMAECAYEVLTDDGLAQKIKNG